MVPELRRYDRIRLAEERLLDCEGVARPFMGQVSVLGTGGMFIRTQFHLPVGTTFGLRVRADGETFETECIVRDSLPGGLGVEFTRRDTLHEDAVRKLMSRVKS